MRVLLITDWNQGHGGAEAYLSWLRSGLTAAGDDVRLLTSSAGSAAGGTAEFGFNAATTGAVTDPVSFTLNGVSCAIP